MIAGLWVFSIVGSWTNFLTLFYIGNEMPLYSSTFATLKVQFVIVNCIYSVVTCYVPIIL